jgi:hypothetical protein
VDTLGTTRSVGGGPAWPLPRLGFYSCLDRDFVSSRTAEEPGAGLTSVIPAAQEAEVRRTAVQSQPGQLASETLSKKQTIPKKGLVGGSR